jgi:hypothetical protein
MAFVRTVASEGGRIGTLGVSVVDWLSAVDREGGAATGNVHLG